MTKRIGNKESDRIVREFCNGLGSDVPSYGDWWKLEDMTGNSLLGLVIESCKSDLGKLRQLFTKTFNKEEWLWLDSMGYSAFHRLVDVAPVLIAEMDLFEDGDLLKAICHPIDVDQDLTALEILVSSHFLGERDPRGVFLYIEKLVQEKRYLEIEDEELRRQAILSLAIYYKEGAEILIRNIRSFPVEWVRDIIKEVFRYHSVTERIVMDSSLYTYIDKVNPDFFFDLNEIYPALANKLLLRRIMRMESALEAILERCGGLS